jgi:hypothetical protein
MRESLREGKCRESGEESVGGVFCCCFSKITAGSGARVSVFKNLQM